MSLPAQSPHPTFPCPQTTNNGSGRTLRTAQEAHYNPPHTAQTAQPITSITLNTNPAAYQSRGGEERHTGMRVSGLAGCGTCADGASPSMMKGYRTSRAELGYITRCFVCGWRIHHRVTNITSTFKNQYSDQTINQTLNPNNIHQHAWPRLRMQLERKLQVRIQLHLWQLVLLQ